jgi:tagaturonate reductase
VDRIVTGYPGPEVEEMASKFGYRDALLTACEIYHSWVIEAPGGLAEELPFADAGLNVRWCRDVAPYRTRKVRLLNGAHTVMTPVAFLAGIDTVLDAMRDAATSAFISDTLYQEILPTIEPPEFPGDRESIQKLAEFDSLDAVELIMTYENSFGESVTDEEAGTIRNPQDALRLIDERAALEKKDIKQFADDVVGRFRNPTIQHRLLSIALNSTSKWKVRVLPSLLEGVSMTGKLPRRLAFSLAALLVLYRIDLDEHGNATGKRDDEPYELKDTLEALRLLSGAWKNYDHHGDPRRLGQEVLGQVSLWGRDLNTVPGLTDSVAADVKRILECGLSPALKELQDGSGG